MSLDSNFVRDKQGAHALYHNALVQSIEGYAVVEGCRVARADGTLGLDDTLVVYSGTIIYNDEYHQIERQNVEIPPAHDDPRWDLVYATDEGVDIVSGEPEPADPEEAVRLSTRRPAPPDLHTDPNTGGDMDRVVPLALVWITPGSREVGSQDIINIRMGADVYGGDASFQSLSVEESPSSITDVVRQAEHISHLGDQYNPHDVTAEQVGAPSADDFSSLEDTVDSHHANTENPHNVTAEQVGAADGSQLSGHVDDVDNPHEVTAAQADALPDTGGTVEGGVTITDGLSFPADGGGTIENFTTLESASHNDVGDTEIHTPAGARAMSIVDGELGTEIMRIRSGDDRTTINRGVSVNDHLRADIVQARDYVQFPVLSDDPTNPPDGAVWVVENGGSS